MDFGKLWEGWRNRLFPPEEIKEFIKQTSEGRLAICNNCENNSDVAKKEGRDFSSKWRPDLHCIICQCNLQSKTSCLSCSCPINKWAAVVTEEQEKEMENAGKPADNI